MRSTITRPALTSKWVRRPPSYLDRLCVDASCPKTLRRRDTWPSTRRGVRSGVSDTVAAHAQEHRGYPGVPPTPDNDIAPAPTGTVDPGGECPVCTANSPYSGEHAGRPVHTTWSSLYIAQPVITLHATSKSLVMASAGSVVSALDAILVIIWALEVAEAGASTVREAARCTTPEKRVISHRERLYIEILPFYPQALLVLLAPQAQIGQKSSESERTLQWLIHNREPPSKRWNEIWGRQNVVQDGSVPWLPNGMSSTIAAGGVVWKVPWAMPPSIPIVRIANPISSRWWWRYCICRRVPDVVRARILIQREMVGSISAEGEMRWNGNSSGRWRIWSDRGRNRSAGDGCQKCIVPIEGHRVDRLESQHDLLILEMLEGLDTPVTFPSCSHLVTFRSDKATAPRQSVYSASGLDFQHLDATGLD